ncbi:MAG: hypothetical protein CM1200mP22_17750 [Dehalococcoidia bacterium]|nr:MAG: hypothetical protein CM1200mP22_17750 [Dehalococcoidia bacterium]
MPSEIILGDAHTHLDQYPRAEMSEILDRARESEVVFAGMCWYYLTIHPRLY